MLLFLPVRNLFDFTINFFSYACALAFLFCNIFYHSFFFFPRVHFSHAFEPLSCMNCYSPKGISSSLSTCLSDCFCI